MKTDKDVSRGLARRESIRLAAAGLAAALLLPAGARAALAASTLNLHDLPPVVLAQDGAPDFDVFYRLSQWITCRAELDDAVARRCFELFLAEPWGKEHLSSTFLQIQAAIEKPGTSVPELLQSGALPEGEAWFAGHILTTWYFGIYYHESSPPVRVAFEEALMWRALDGLVEAPGFSTQEPGAWRVPPPAAASVYRP